MKMDRYRRRRTVDLDLDRPPLYNWPAGWLAGQVCLHADEQVLKIYTGTTRPALPSRCQCLIYGAPGAQWALI